MLRVRERSNQWPSFTDLFSNLVIVLVFLLIVFVFLWTSTNAFKSGGATSVAELRKVTAEQSQQIEQLKLSEQQAKALLLTARDELLNLDKTKSELESQRSTLQSQYRDLESQNQTLASEKDRVSAEQMEIVAAYEKKLYELQNEQQSLTRTIGNLQANLSSVEGRKNMEMQELVTRAAGLQSEIERMNLALNAAEQRGAQKDVEYAALSERMNRALADKVSELNELGKYQSQFIKSIRDAVSGTSGVDVTSDRFVISSDILFPVGSFNLSPEGKNQIKVIAGVLKNLETKIPSTVKWVIRIDGHTDRLAVNKNAKLYKNNLELSLLRAREVAKELNVLGVASNRLVPAGFGETHPLVEGKTAKDLQKNRRIELRLTNP